jgi:predicted ATPase
LLEQAQKAQDPVFLVEGHWALGVALAYTGEFTASLERLERAVALFEPSQYHSHTRHTGHDPAVASRCQAAWMLWSLGQPDRALERIGEALALAEELGHPQSLTMAAYFAAHLHQLRREAGSCGERAQATIELAAEHGLIDRMTLGTVQRGWALAERGQVEEGLEAMRRGLAEYKQRGAGLRQPYFLGLLADVLHKTGQAEQALEVLAEALAAAHHTGDLFYEAELYRLKGEVLLTHTRAGTEAEGCLKQAIEISRRQQAKSWELRSVMSLARLYRQQGKQQQARQRLKKAYDCFSEGLHTADLREAKALLDELS